MYCKNCGCEMPDGAAVCSSCGSAQGGTPAQAPNPAPVYYNAAPTAPVEQKSKLAAGLLNILIPIGIGNFYLGYTGKAVAQLLLGFFCGVGVIWSLIDGILILTGKPNVDAKGIPLKD